MRKAIRELSGARLVFLAEILARPQPHRAGLRQVQDPAAKGRGREVTKPSAKPAAKSSLNTRPPNAPHTSKTPDTCVDPKSRTLCLMTFRAEKARRTAGRGWLPLVSGEEIGSGVR